ncbi:MULTISPECIES: ATP-dependent DNA helicase RecG [Pseudoxanthomonas]|jgi:ATP-dependent DNA helicase RecG|uniref:ATP-dependent DNA helicase RecG n=1 Tax=Pseudoxanthomonas winnipegensis TaxID=2480810 RepID=A0A4Q8LE73_9GAMM|nr:MULTISPECIES: ATP-dependent DNA helicase RecG [Pseudoxanthomonas]TAA27041.1 ATP-dependent DNA helicase RecG [Pseudoxanthomonas winnipegensis]TMN16039.1 ATP-dependent DNA helicase RecG [Pseudoxanthomonas sp. X-1]UAY76599.1 ATP-dependent DNA helicase RecG [Pseudoxanthomonas sp. X-1]
MSPARRSLEPAFTQPIVGLSGAGPKLAEKLAARGLLTLQDLWLLLPLRYEDRTSLTPIARLQPGVAAQVEGRIEAVERGFRYRPVLRVAIGDESRATLVLRFFHFRAAQVAQFAVGARLRVYGVPRQGQQGLEIVHPSYRLLDAQGDTPLGETLEPVYPAVDGVGPAVLRKLISQSLDRLPDQAALELLPEGLLRASRLPDGSMLPSLREALLTMHRPARDADVAALSAGTHPAQRRLALEELLAHHLSLRRQRIALQRHGAHALAGKGALVAKLLKTLPFKLTGAQQRVFAQIRTDLAQPHPMLRLVQGDVGSGKTVVAALAAMLAVESGKQVALAAPTELLAEQHLANLRGWLEPLGVRVAWLAGKVTGKARARVLEEVASGTAQVVVGTHALMQDAVAFHDLALAIVDEQHRFGVHQRLALRDKGTQAGTGASRVPHQLVMTATPIPRTLAMAAYADLDVSAIDELPPGRTPVQTIVLSAERRPELIERIRVACAEGRQVYWVCTLIEEAEDDAKAPAGGAGPALRFEAQAAQTTFEQLTAALPQARVALVHGRMKPAEKQAVMRAFKQGECDLLVATTVIEVGVDVPNASLMVIENAERLGLAQLHQLRGRVGRGAMASSCVLLYQAPLSQMARERLDTMRQTNDGFVIAEKDLELRGPGELLGTRQTGLAAFRVADLARDAGLLPQVHALADRLLDTDPALADRLIARWIGGAARYASA